jgi:hypothetical protein
MRWTRSWAAVEAWVGFCVFTVPDRNDGDHGAVPQPAMVGAFWGADGFAHYLGGRRGQGDGGLWECAKFFALCPAVRP